MKRLDRVKALEAKLGSSSENGSESLRQLLRYMTLEEREELYALRDQVPAGGSFNNQQMYAAAALFTRAQARRDAGEPPPQYRRVWGPGIYGRLERI